MGPRAGLEGCGKSRLSPGFDPRTAQPVVSRYTDCAIPDHKHKFTFKGNPIKNGCGGLVVSMLNSDTQVRGFKPGRSRRIFRGEKISSACLPSEGK
jgi:hypothetical protein